MAVDLSGGLDPQLEYFTAQKPDDPQMRDSATLWVMDQAGELALPRVTFDAISADWANPCVQLNFVDRHGRTMRLWSNEPASLNFNGKMRLAQRIAGPLDVACIEPFSRWRFAFEGQALQSTTEMQLAGEPDGEAVDLAFAFEADMAAPPWLMGGMTQEAAHNMQRGAARALMGGFRYEQLCRVRGFVRAFGVEHSITGTGMRVRRQGVRNMGAALGHCQHSALFPSGRGFGAIVMAPGPEGPQVFNEAFLVDERGRQTPARVVEAPWMTRLVSKGDDASLVLESEGALVHIEGKVLNSLFDHHLFEMADSSILHQGTALYSWNGEQAIGLIERCTLRDGIS